MAGSLSAAACAMICARYLLRSDDDYWIETECACRYLHFARAVMPHATRALARQAAGGSVGRLAATLKPPHAPLLLRHPQPHRRGAILVGREGRSALSAIPPPRMR